LINNITWVLRCEKGFTETKSNKNAVAEAYQLQLKDLEGLILMVQGDLEKSVRTKCMCMITMDAHSRDILKQLRDEGIDDAEHFVW
jgi:dynein heavy chain